MLIHYFTLIYESKYIFFIIFIVISTVVTIISIQMLFHEFAICFHGDEPSLLVALFLNICIEIIVTTVEMIIRMIKKIYFNSYIKVK